MNTITYAMLRGACKEQRQIFRDTFGKSVEVTEENVLRAARAGLDLNWGTKWFTPSALKAYREAIAPALKAYEEATASAKKAYDEATAPAWTRAYLESVGAPA